MYDVREAVSLAAVIADGGALSQLAATGRPVGSISILRVSAGGSFFLRIGNAQWVPISSACTFYGFDPLKEGKQGVFIRNDTAQAGVTFDVLIGYVSDRDIKALEAGEHS